MQVQEKTKPSLQKQESEWLKTEIGEGLPEGNVFRQWCHGFQGLDTNSMY